MGGPHGNTHRSGVEEGIHLVPGSFRRLAEHRDGYRRWVPAPLGSQGVEELAAFFHLSRGRTRRQPAVGVPGHALEDVGSMATQEDRWMGFLRRFGIAIHRWEVVVAAVEFGLILRPQLLQRHYRLSGLGPPVGEVAAHHRGLLPVPTGPNPEDKPAVAVEVQHCNLFGENERLAFVHQRYT